MFDQRITSLITIPLFVNYGSNKVRTVNHQYTMFLRHAKSIVHRISCTVNRPWWLCGLTYDITALNCCMVHVWSQVPTRDQDIDRLELDITWRYSNSKALGGSCVAYDIGKEETQLTKLLNQSGFKPQIRTRPRVNKWNK